MLTRPPVERYVAFLDWMFISWKFFFFGKVDVHKLKVLEPSWILKAYPCFQLFSCICFLFCFLAKYIRRYIYYHQEGKITYLFLLWWVEVYPNKIYNAVDLLAVYFVAAVFSPLVGSRWFIADNLIFGNFAGINCRIKADDALYTFFSLSRRRRRYAGRTQFQNSWSWSVLYYSETS